MNRKQDNCKKCRESFNNVQRFENTNLCEYCFNEEFTFGIEDNKQGTLINYKKIKDNHHLFRYKLMIWINAMLIVATVIIHIMDLNTKLKELFFVIGIIAFLFLIVFSMIYIFNKRICPRCKKNMSRYSPQSYDENEIYYIYVCHMCKLYIDTETSLGIEVES